MSMVIISGNIDISVGSLIGVLATISGTLAVDGVPIVLCWIIPVIVAIAFTTLMGAMVAYLRIPSIVVSLGFLSILKGGLISATGGAWINTLPEGFHLAQMRPLGVPMPIYFMVVLTIAAAFWMRSRRPGARSTRVGGNAEAARLSGINRERTIVKVFAIHGFFVGIAAILFATQLAIIQSTVPPEPRADDHHRLGGRRRLDPRRHRHGDRLDACGDPDRGDRLVADLHQRLALLAARRAGRADPAHRARRSVAAARQARR